MPEVRVSDVLSGIADKINSEFKLEVALTGDSETRSDVRIWVPTASPMLNLLFGKKGSGEGIPVGRVIEIFGDYSHGKSTILQLIINAFQAAGGITNLIDSESGWDKERAIAMGHNQDRHLTVEVDTVESGFNVIGSLLNKYKETFRGTQTPILFGWDTIAASPTEGEKAGDEYSSGMMYKARKIRQELKKLNSELGKVNATVVFVNQTIEGPKDKYSKPKDPSGVKTTPGGGGIKFWASQRLQVERIKVYHDPANKTKPQGIISNCKMVKNKLSPPFREVDMCLNYTQGTDPLTEIVNFLLDHSKVVNISGAYRKIVGFGDKDISFYERDQNKTVADNPGLYEWLVEQAREVWWES